MWWKIFFVISFLFFAFDLKTTNPSLFDFFSLVVNILGLIGLYAFVFNKKIFSTQIWKGIFILSIFRFAAGVVISTPNIIQNISKASLEGPVMLIGIPFIIALILVIFYWLVYPLYFALYKLSQGKTRKDSRFGGFRIKKISNANRK